MKKEPFTGEILKITIDELWEIFKKHENEEFLTMKKLPFSYTIKGGEMFVDRRSKSITKATVSKALETIQRDPEKVTGPKAMNVFGAPYIFALLKNLFPKAGQ